MYTLVGWLIIQIYGLLNKEDHDILYRKSHDIVLYRVQGGSYAFSKHIEMMVVMPNTQNSSASSC